MEEHDKDIGLCAYNDQKSSTDVQNALIVVLVISCRYEIQKISKSVDAKYVNAPFVPLSYA